MVDEIRVTSREGGEVHRIAGETEDEVEGTLVIEAREPAARRPDLLAAVRERPLPALALVFGAGLALGLLTGGKEQRFTGDDDEDDEEDREDDDDEDEVAEDGASATARLRSFISEQLSGIATEAVQQLARRLTHK